MRLDRNTSPFGRGKYGLVKNRRLLEIVRPIGDSHNAKNMDDVSAMKVREAIKLLVEEGVIDWGDTPETEFFVMRLRDKYASGALAQYASAARGDGEHL